MNPIEICPLCKQISESSLITSEDDCVVLRTNRNDTVVASKEHVDKLKHESLVKALDLLEKVCGKGFLSEFDECPGHWAMRFNRVDKDFDFGKATMVNE